MNVQFFMAAISDAAYSLLCHLGLCRPEIANRRISTVWAQAKLNFKRELQVGDSYYVESTIAAIGPKTFTYRHRLRLAGSDELVMDAETLAVCLDLDTRRSTAIPADVAERARLLLEGEGDD